MKQFITSIAFVTLSLIKLDAQIPSAKSAPKNDNILQYGEEVVILDGKVMIVKKDRTATELQKIVVTRNGRSIRPDGTIIHKGDTTKLRAGQIIFASGGEFNAPVIAPIEPSDK